jgi:hypothetical protein
MVVGLGVALLLGGLLLALLGRVTATAPSPSFPGALPPGPRSSRRHLPATQAHPRGYRVFVPRVGSFRSIDDAEQKALDRRWASAGSPTLGARGTRQDVSGAAGDVAPPEAETPAVDGDSS